MARTDERTESELKPTGTNDRKKEWQMRIHGGPMGKLLGKYENIREKTELVLINSWDVSFFFELEHLAFH
jgi:hypothetical protein